MQRVSLVFSLISAAFCLAKATEFAFSGRLQCGSVQEGKEWCYKITVNEVDPGPDDLIAETSGCVNTPFADYSATGKVNGDGWFDYNYEIAYTLEHNCGGFNDQIKLPVFQTPTNIKFKHFRRNFDLQRMG